MKQKEKQTKLWALAAWDMLYLVACSINASIPNPDRIVKMDLEKVYALSKSQSLEAMTYMALERLMNANPSAEILGAEQVLARWEEAKHKAIRNTLLMDAAREGLFGYLEEQGIWHLPLKGAVLCRMYPEFGMRQMADNDILFDASFRQKVHDWFVEHGYTVESFQKSNHDEYHKEPIYNFEMHTALFFEAARPQFAQYYLTIMDRLHPVSGKAFEYYMTDEDFYLYLLAHTYKHYSDKGTGLRSLLDVYVCNTANPKMDRSYLDAELKKIGLLRFEKEMRELAQKVFVPEINLNALSENDLIMLQELLFSRTYGTKEIFWKNQIRKMQPNGNKISTAVKLQYFMRRIFPEKAHMEHWCRQYAPYFIQHQKLMPVAFIWRIVKKVPENIKAIKAELDVVRKA